MMNMNLILNVMIMNWERDTNNDNDLAIHYIELFTKLETEITNTKEE